MTLEHSRAVMQSLRDDLRALREKEQTTKTLRLVRNVLRELAVLEASVPRVATFKRHHRRARPQSF